MMYHQKLKEIKKEIKLDSQKPSQFADYRKLHVPRVNMEKRTKRPFQKEFKKGNFRNDMYFHMDPLVIIATYVKCITMACLPAFALHGFLYFIHVMSKLATPDDVPTYMFGTKMLLFVYMVCLYFGLRKASDHMAFFTVDMLLSKFRINRIMLGRIQNGVDLENDKEFIVMDYYRTRFNKYLLFPSRKELAMAHQLDKAQRTHHESRVRDYAKLRRERLTMDHRREEHEAAKLIAQWKQSRFGGENEYEAFAKRYQHRTIPLVRSMVD